jgi:hypothetical protein
MDCWGDETEQALSSSCKAEKLCEDKQAVDHLDG